MALIDNIALYFAGTTLTGSAVKAISYISEDNEPYPDRVKKVGITTTVTGATSTTIASHSFTRHASYNETSAYVESLSDEQLASLSDALKINQFEIEKDVNKKLTKKA